MAAAGQNATELGKPIVEFRNITKIYPGSTSPALKVDQLMIAQGEFFSVLGPSGSGKTTALRMIAGFERPNSGQVMIDGADVTDVPAYKRDVNTVFQSYALFPHLTIAQNTQYPLKMKGVEKSQRQKRALEALSMVEMSKFADRYPHQLSGGQRQRAALARAFVGRPKILLLDEPLSALDLNLRHQMQHLLVALHRELGLTFVYVTHDQGEAMSMSDRVAVVADGEIMQLASPREIYYKPENKFIADFIGKSNFIPLTIATSGNARVGEIDNQSFEVHTGCRPGAAQLSMRYERISVTPMDAEMKQPVVLSGRIVDILFLGATAEVKVKCGDSELIAVVPSSLDMNLHPNQTVRVGFNPANGHLFNV